MNRLNTSSQKRVQRDFRSRSLPAVTLSALIICGLSISSCAKESVTKAMLPAGLVSASNCMVNLETAHPLTTAALKIRTAINDQLTKK